MLVDYFEWIRIRTCASTTADELVFGWNVARGRAWLPAVPCGCPWLHVVARGHSGSHGALGISPNGTFLSVVVFTEAATGLDWLL